MMDSEIPPSYKSNHAPVTCFFRNPNGPRGPGLWRFNNNLLNNPLYVKKIQQTIVQTNAENQSAAPDTLWEVMKGRIQLDSMEYKKEKRLHQKVLIEELQLQIFEKHVELNNVAIASDYTKEIRETILRLQSNLKDQYEDIQEVERNERIARAFRESERCTKYFFSFGRNFPLSTIKQLLRQDGAFATCDREIIKECEQFHTRKFINDLDYTSQEYTKYLESFLDPSTMPYLSDASRESLQMEITEEEWFEALKSMAGGKSLGSDGLTVNFYKHFWN